MTPVECHGLARHVFYPPLFGGVEGLPVGLHKINVFSVSTFFLYQSSNIVKMSANDTIYG
jgi:hypothetical protein